MTRNLWIALLVLSSAGVARAAEPEEPRGPANWAAPPYWVPPHTAALRDEAGSRHSALPASPEATAAAASALPFFTLAPCRLADTRYGAGFSGPFGPPSIPGSTLRSFPITGQCGIPANAQAVSFNFTVTNTLGPGFLVVYPQGSAVPNVSTLNYVGYQTVANAAVVPLGAGGGLSVIPGVSGTDLIIDVNGYYAPSGIVSSLNSLTGDVTITAGSNLTLTPSGNTLTLSATLTGLSASNVTSGVLGLSFGGTGATSSLGARLNLGAAAAGANNDISSLSGLITPLSIAQGGTGSATPFQSAFQARVTGTCSAGSFLVSIGADGSVGCGTPIADPRPGFVRSTLDTGNVGQYASITVGADGLGLMSYLDSANGSLKAAHCSNAACTSAAATTLDTGGAGYYTSIAIGSDGLGLISYFTASGDLKVAHCNDSACASATVSLLESTLTLGAAGTSLAIGSDGLGLIAYLHSRNGHLKVAHCANASCTSASTFTIDGSFDVGLSPSIAIGSDGLGLISYYDDANQDLKVAHCNDTSCSTATAATLDSVGIVGTSSSITIGDDGLGLISYGDLSSSNLKVAHCANAACSAASLAALDSIGTTAQFTSISVGADGLGLISYQNYATGNLKVAHCANVACSSAATVPVETGVFVGTTALTVGADGLGLIGYWDSTNRNLKVLHCGNALCTPFVRRR
jgi:hypothetical protein